MLHVFKQFANRAIAAKENLGIAQTIFEEALVGATLVSICRIACTRLQALRESADTLRQMLRFERSGLLGFFCGCPCALIDVLDVLDDFVTADDIAADNDPLGVEIYTTANGSD